MEANTILTPNEVNGIQRKEIVIKAIKLIHKDIGDIDEMIIYVLGLSDLYAFLFDSIFQVNNNEVEAERVALKQIDKKITEKFNLPTGFSAFISRFVKNLSTAKYKDHSSIIENIEDFFI